MHRTLSLVVFFFLSFPISAAGVKVGVRDTDNSVIKALQEGKIDEAIWRDEVSGCSPEGLLRRARLARDDRKFGDALCYFEAYLQYFPFGRLSWTDQVRKQWTEVATEYVELLARTDGEKVAWFKPSIGSIDAYKEIQQCFAQKDAAKYTRLADEILAKYPESIFVQAAILTVATGRSMHGHGGGFQSGEHILADYLGRMQAKGIPERDQLLVKLMRDERARHSSASSGRRSEPPSEQIPTSPRPRGGRLVPGRPDLEPEKVEVRQAPEDPRQYRFSSFNPFVRREALKERFFETASSGNVEAAREHAKIYLEDFPPEFRREPRGDLTHAWLAAKQPEEAMA